MKNYYDDSEIQKTLARDALFSHAGAILVGLLIGAIATYGMIEPSINRMKKKLDTTEQQLSTEQQARLETLMKCQPGASADQSRIDELTEELARADKQLVAEGSLLAEQKNVATVLYEPAAPSTASVTFTVAGRALAVPGMKNMQPRWCVPGKVVPILYGGQTYGANGVEEQYIWVDAQGNHAGPFPAKMFVQAAQ